MLKILLISMNKKWERKPREDPPEWAKFRIEDLFLCHNCKGWFPWFKYCVGQKIVFPNTNSDNTYEYMNDNEDRGGRRWACDDCIKKLLYESKIITITNEKGKIIDFNSNHPFR